MLLSTVSDSGGTAPCVQITIDDSSAKIGETIRSPEGCLVRSRTASMGAVSNVPTSPRLLKAVESMVGERDMAHRIARELFEAKVSAEELETLLDRAMSRDAWTNVARHALRDGLPSSLATLALNLWGFAGFSELTGHPASAAALYGASLGSAIVVLDEVFRHMFENMTYTPAEMASPVPLASYLVATTLPLTFRNILRAITHVSLVLAGKPELVPGIDNGIEIGGGMLATMATGHAMERLSLPGERERQRGILMRSDLASVVGHLREGRMDHTRRLARQAGGAALRAVPDVPMGLRKLFTPGGIVTVGTLAAFVPAAVTTMDAIQDAIDNDTRGISEGSAELARVGILFSAYLLLAGSARYATPVFGKASAALKRVGNACLTGASQMTSNHFTAYWRKSTPHT